MQVVNFNFFQSIITYVYYLKFFIVLDFYCF